MGKFRDYNETTVDDYLNAYVAYRRLTNSPRNQNTIKRFNDFISADSKVAESRILWLTGPNAEVLYKVWKAQNE